MNIVNKNKLYILPMKVVCNANCTWCVSKQNEKSGVREKLILDEEFKINFEKYLPILIKMNIQKLEFTGGGEPFLNEHLQEIINFISIKIPNTYKKLYSNGFIHKPIYGIDELNISRSHWDSNLNKLVYRSKFQNDLLETTKFFKPLVPKLRTCTVLQKGFIDSESKAIEMINRLPLVDQFVFRPLISETPNHDEVKIDFPINHSKAIKDEIDCACHKALVLGPNGKLYYDFNFNEEIKVEDLCG